MISGQLSFELIMQYIFFIERGSFGHTNLQIVTELIFLPGRYNLNKRVCHQRKMELQSRRNKMVSIRLYCMFTGFYSHVSLKKRRFSNG